jgi:YbbR domain-containing protein
MARYAAEHDIKTVASTNCNTAFFHDETHMEKLLKSGLSTLILAVDSIHQDSYAMYRKKGDLNRALEGIKQATALIDIQGAVQDVDQILQVSVGSSNVTLEPSTVRVVVPIVEMVPTKIVPVLIQVAGSPAAGYYVKNTISDPVSVQLSGQPETLITITNIKTVPLDITGVDKSFAIEVGLAVPQGVIVQPSRVKVQVEVVKGEAPASNVTNGNGAEKPKT